MGPNHNTLLSRPHGLIQVGNEHFMSKSCFWEVNKDCEFIKFIKAFQNALKFSRLWGMTMWFEVDNLHHQNWKRWKTSSVGALHDNHTSLASQRNCPKTRQVQLSVRFLLVLHCKFANATQVFVMVNVIGRSLRIQKTNQTTPTYLVLKRSKCPKEACAREVLT